VRTLTPSMRIRPATPLDAPEIGDVDPRGDASYCWEISDKSLAVGGGVLEALLSRRDIRRRLGEQAGAAG